MGIGSSGFEAMKDILYCVAFVLYNFVIWMFWYGISDCRDRIEKLEESIKKCPPDSTNSK